jgi:glutaredoxin 2
MLAFATAVPPGRASRPVLRAPHSARSVNMAVARPAQVVLTPQLPRVYVYDHCPFACRVRYALGVKNVKHNVVWLMNDDVATPTALVGKKVVPVFEPLGGGGPAQMESLDICAAVDADARYGPPGLFRPASGRTDISAWVSAHAMTVRRLTRPRVVAAPLPEFVFADARDAFVRNHPLPDPSSYEENLADSPRLVADLQSHMAALDDAIHCAEHCTPGGLSFDDIDLFPRLRTLTLVKGLVLPPKTLAYLRHHSAMSEVGLYFCYAT